jgi:ribosomal protein S18 acetylase RimI-like enzyme
VEIKNLASTTIESIVGCLSKSFSDYFVPMSSDIEYWRARFQVARIDLSLSFGCFDKGELAGFILIGIDQHEGYLTAYNGGTGVVPEYRGKHIVDKLYEHALPLFKNAGIERCTLEVIDKNLRAITVYERIGFTKTKTLHCYRGMLNADPSLSTITQIDLSVIDKPELQEPQFLSWDHTINGLKAAGDMYSVYALNHTSGPGGFFVINRANGYIAQWGNFEVDSSNYDWNSLVASVNKIATTIKTNNVDSRRTGLRQSLERNGLENFINQFEMELFI